MGSILLFLVPLPWLVAWVIAVSFHEFCHLAAVKVLGGNVLAFSINLGGVNMECADLTERDYLLSILAGPLGGFVLGLVGRWFPRLAICSWLLSVYNLIPVLPLDGGRVLQILVKKNAVFLAVEKIILGLSLLAAMICLFADFGTLPLIIAISLWIKNRKRPCKETIWGVQ